MGNLLGAPVTEKDTHVGSTENGIEYGVSSMQGWRVHMEDAHITETSLYAAEVMDNNQYNIIDIPGHSLYAVFDGHGGMYAAVYAGNNLCRVLSRQAKFIEYAKFELERPTKVTTFTSSTEQSEYLQSGMELLRDALTSAFIEIDKEIYFGLYNQRVADADLSYQQIRYDAMKGNNTNENGHSPQQQHSDMEINKVEDELNAGTTACVVIVTPIWVVCANAGDSRAVLCRHNEDPTPLSFDHKPDDEIEERRIRNAGGYVAGGRVEGDLAVSRGLGDFRFKNVAVVISVPFSGISTMNHTTMPITGVQIHPTMQPGDQKVSPIPDIIIHPRLVDKDQFILVACDGIWDVQSNVEAVKTVGGLFEEGESNLGLICEEFCDVGLALGSKDNMTVLVVKFESQKVGPGGGVTARRQLRNKDASNVYSEKNNSQLGYA